MIKGNIVGGNLAVVAAMSGTEYVPSFRNKILLRLHLEFNNCGK